MKYLAIFILFSVSLFSQQYTITGSVKESGSDSPLPFANVRVAGGTLGSAANKNGIFELRLPAGKQTIVASYLGYYSDSLTIEPERGELTLHFHLRKSTLILPEVTVLPSENPADFIIQKAIERKYIREEALHSYTYEAFTKAAIKTTEDLNAQGNGRSISMGFDTDTSELKITGILENHSIGYVKKPDYHKDIILARKQTSNLPANMNLLTGGRLVQNFYSNDIEFFNTEMVSPLSDGALDYYFFYLRDSLSIDGQRVYKIFMTPDNESDPGFLGHIYILSQSYDLLKVELTLNDAANTGGIFDSIGVFQQFFPYTKNNIYMPVDYHLGVEANFLGLARIGFELNTSLFDYNINIPIEDDFFDMAVITVKPNADEKDSTYWDSIPVIPSTEPELEAYTRIDSLTSIPETFWDRYSFLSSTVDVNKNFSFSNFMGLYHFNRVEGNTLDFGLSYNDDPVDRFYSNLDFSYGFSDEKLKTDFFARYYFGDYRTERLSVRAFDKLAVQFSDADSYGEFFNSLAALISKYEFRDYYYTKGFALNFRSDIFPILRADFGFVNRTDNNALTNSDFSFFNTDKSYRPNKPVYETRLNIFKLGITFNFHNYIEDGKYRRRFYGNKSYAGFSADIEFSRKDLLSSSLDFTTYGIQVYGRLKTSRSTGLHFRLNGKYNEGSRPYQMLFTAPGNINIMASDYTFRTLEYNEIQGDRIFTAFLEHRFGNSLFRWLSIPLLKDSDLNLTAFFNSALVTISDDSRNILVNPVSTFEHPFYETGFSIGHAFFPLSLHFGWKLNYTEKNSFRIGIDSAILF